MSPTERKLHQAIVALGLPIWAVTKGTVDPLGDGRYRKATASDKPYVAFNLAQRAYGIAMPETWSHSRRLDWLAEWEPQIKSALIPGIWD